MPLQNSWPGPHTGVHAPLMQLDVGPHCTLQPPQFAGFVSGSMHWPLHSTRFGGQMPVHVLFEQS